MNLEEFKQAIGDNWNDSLVDIDTRYRIETLDMINEFDKAGKGIAYRVVLILAEKLEHLSRMNEDYVTVFFDSITRLIEKNAIASEQLINESIDIIEPIFPTT